MEFSLFDVGPGDRVFFFWVEFSWVSEITVVVFGVQFCLGCFGSLDEVLEILSVGEVRVKIVLEMLDKVHMVLNEVVSSNSIEGKSVIIELPGVNANSWFLTLFGKLCIDGFGIVIILNIELS